LELSGITLRRRIIVPLGIALLLILAAFISWAVIKETNTRQTYEEMRNDKVHLAFNASIENNKVTLGVALAGLTERKDIIELFKRRDRKALLALSTPLYNTLNSKFNITHFYFTDQNRINFLRVHQPDRYGDTIDRVTTLEAEQRGKPFAGLELGPLGTFTLRYVLPLIENGAIIGFLEMGMEIEHVLPTIIKQLNADLYVTLHKDTMNRNTWERGMNHLGRDAAWDRFENVVMIYEPHGKSLSKDIIQQIDHHQNIKASTHLEFELKGRTYNVGFVPILDARNQSVGDFVIVADSTDLVSQSWKQITYLSSTCVAIGVIYLFWLFPFLGRIELRLIEQDEQMSALINSSGIGIFGMNEQGDCTFCNPAGLKILGHDKETLLGKDIHSTIHHSHPDGSPYLLSECPVHLAITEGIGNQTPHETFWKKDGTSIDVSYITQPVFIRGKMTGAVVNFRDITQDIKMDQTLRIAMEEAVVANQAKSEFLSSMSHELRTPMNAILGFAQVLDTEPLTERQKFSVEHIIKGGEHLLELINQVLELNQIEAGRLTYRLEDFHAYDLMRDTLGLIEMSAKDNNIKIINETSKASLPDLKTDGTRLKQVLLNLLSNALKYNSPEGSITLSCETLPDSFFRIKVSDTGIGIPLKNQSDLFTPFERLGHDNSNIEGTGIGLTISKRIIETMGGRINFKSVEGKGSEFWVDVPITPSSQTSA